MDNSRGEADARPSDVDGAVAWPTIVLRGEESSRDGVVELTGTTTDGPVRVIALARSRRAIGAAAEAQLAVDTALEAALRMLGATGRDLDAAIAAIPRGIVNRWRASHGTDRSVPGANAGEGTSLVLALTGPRGVRVVRFGSGAGSVLAADGVSHLTYVPPLAAADHPVGLDEADQAGPEALAPPLGLDHPDAARTYDTLRVSAGHRPTLVLLSGTPEDGISEGERSAWSTMLADVDERLASEADLDDSREPTDGSDRGDDTTPPAGSELADLLPPSVGTAVLAWLPADRRAVAAPLAPPAAVAPAPSVAATRGSSGSARWLPATLIALLVVGLAALAWAVVSPRGTAPTPSATPSTRVTPTPSASSPAASTPPAASPVPSTEPPSAAPTPTATRAPAPATTRRPTRAPTRAPSLPSPTATPAPVASTAQPTATTAGPTSSSSATSTPVATASSTATATSTATSEPTPTTTSTGP